MSKRIKIPNSGDAFNLIGPYTGFQTSEPVADYVLNLSDDDDTVYMLSAGVTLVQLPKTFPPGFKTTIYQDGTGQVVFTPEPGATAQARGGNFGTSGQYAAVIADVRFNADGISADWRLRGDLAHATQLPNKASLGGGSGFNSSANQVQLLTAKLSGASSVGPNVAQRQTNVNAAFAAAAVVSAVGTSPH